MEIKDLNYDFVPQNIVIGRFNNDCGFVSCRYKYETWKNTAVFERLCKFKPNEQRDPEKELKKAIYNAVSTYVNEPVTGFEFVNYDKDLYNRYYHECSDIVLKDPRGFRIAITNDNFWYMMKTVGFNMADGVINHKFAYAWSKDSQFMLVDAETKHFTEVKAKSDTYKVKIDNNVYITKRQLVPGKIYQGTEKFPGKHMYLGEMEVYDERYHKIAFENFKYKSVDAYRESDALSYDITGKKMVFYRIDKKGNSRIEYNQPYPFNFKSSISKLLEREVDDGNEDIELLPMFNDKTKPSTYENIKEYMTTCLTFNKVDFNTLQNGNKKCPYDLFEEIIGYTCNKSVGTNDVIPPYPYSAYDLSDCAFVAGNCGATYRNFSFGLGYDSQSFSRSMFGVQPDSYSNTSYAGKYIRIKTYSTREYYIIDAKERDSYWSRSKEYCRIKDFNISNLYNVINPMLGTAKFENGKDVPDIYMLLLQRENMR